MRQHGFEQMVKVRTREPLLWKQRTVHSGLVTSDHLVNTLSPLVPAKPSRKYVFFRDTCDHLKMAMDRKLEECNLIFADTLDDSEEGVRLFNDKLWAISDESFPLIKVKMSSRYVPISQAPLSSQECSAVYNLPMRSARCVATAIIA